MRKYVPAILIGLLVAAVWGYFSDLRNDQVAWFIGRLIIVPLSVVVVLAKMRPTAKTDSRA